MNNLSRQLISFNGAAINRPRKPPAARRSISRFTTLQWGRDQSTAETGRTRDA